MSIGLLILRLVVGLTLAAHGAQKLFGWFGGYGLTGTGGFREQLGFVPGRRAALFAGLAETGAGLLLALVSLPCLAYASPPDPTWLVGFYDDADYDDVVGSINSLAGVLVPESLRVCLPAPTRLSLHVELGRSTSGAPLTVR